MPNTLIFPDGVRLAEKDEIPGPEARRSADWARIESADIAPGFIIKSSSDERFARYAEVNVDAPHIWSVFRDLCEALLEPAATLIASEIDDEPVSLGSAGTLFLLSILEPHAYQLAHNGFLQFGLLCVDENLLNEVFVAPTKHFKVWLNDEPGFQSVMAHHGLREDPHIQFVDEYPRTTLRLPDRFGEPRELMRNLENEIASWSRTDEQVKH